MQAIPTDSQGEIQIRTENQQSPVAEEVSALTAVVRPILEGTLYSVKKVIADKLGGFERLTLEMLARVYRPGDGDCGICFEYAIHDAVRRHEGTLLDRLDSALTTHCKVPGKETASILFGLEKNGALKLIDTARTTLTDESALLYGTRGRPARLKPYIEYVANAFRRPGARTALPYSISGIWKTDLFLGHSDSDKWVATTIKINPTQLQGAKGLRIGIVPTKQGKSDKIYKDESLNLVICPVPHDQAFMQVFYEGWAIVQQFIAADAKVPREVALPRPAHRQVARSLEERRSYPVIDVIEVLKALGQPELLRTESRTAATIDQRDVAFITRAVVAPMPMVIGKAVRAIPEPAAREPIGGLFGDQLPK